MWIGASLHADLRGKLIEQMLNEIRKGRLNDRGFEELIATILKSLEATDVGIVPRRLDKGADILATFWVATSFKFMLAVQDKHYQREPLVGGDVVDQLVQGIEAEDVDLGWVVTRARFQRRQRSAKQSWRMPAGVALI